jgi:hypothetical protein
LGSNGCPIIGHHLFLLRTDSERHRLGFPGFLDKIIA